MERAAAALVAATNNSRGKTTTTAEKRGRDDEQTTSSGAEKNNGTNSNNNNNNSGGVGGSSSLVSEDEKKRLHNAFSATVKDTILLVQRSGGKFGGGGGGGGTTTTTTVSSEIAATVVDPLIQQMDALKQYIFFVQMPDDSYAVTAAKVLAHICKVFQDVTSPTKEHKFLNLAADFCTQLCRVISTTGSRDGLMVAVPSPLQEGGGSGSEKLQRRRTSGGLGVSGADETTMCPSTQICNTIRALLRVREVRSSPYIAHLCSMLRQKFAATIPNLTRILEGLDVEPRQEGEGGGGGDKGCGAALYHIQIPYDRQVDEAQVNTQEEALHILSSFLLILETLKLECYPLGFTPSLWDAIVKASCAILEVCDGEAFSAYVLVVIGTWISLLGGVGRSVLLAGGNANGGGSAVNGGHACSGSMPSSFFSTSSPAPVLLSPENVAALLQTLVRFAPFALPSAQQPLAVLIEMLVARYPKESTEAVSLFVDGSIATTVLDMVCSSASATADDGMRCAIGLQVVLLETLRLGYISAKSVSTAGAFFTAPPQHGGQTKMKYHDSFSASFAYNSGVTEQLAAFQTRLLVGYDGGVKSSVTTRNTLLALNGPMPASIVDSIVRLYGAASAACEAAACGDVKIAVDIPNESQLVSHHQQEPLGRPNTVNSNNQVGVNSLLFFSNRARTSCKLNPLFDPHDIVSMAVTIRLDATEVDEQMANAAKARGAEAMLSKQDLTGLFRKTCETAAMHLRIAKEHQACTANRTRRTNGGDDAVVGNESETATNYSHASAAMSGNAQHGGSLYAPAFDTSTRASLQILKNILPDLKDCGAFEAFFAMVTHLPVAEQRLVNMAAGIERLLFAAFGQEVNVVREYLIEKGQAFILCGGSGGNVVCEGGIHPPRSIVGKALSSPSTSPCAAAASDELLAAPVMPTVLEGPSSPLSGGGRSSGGRASTKATTSAKAAAAAAKRAMSFPQHVSTWITMATAPTVAPLLDTTAWIRVVRAQLRILQFGVNSQYTRGKSMTGVSSPIPMAYVNTNLIAKLFEMMSSDEQFWRSTSNNNNNNNVSPQEAHLKEELRSVVSLCFSLILQVQVHHRTARASAVDVDASDEENNNTAAESVAFVHNPTQGTSSSTQLTGGNSTVAIGGGPGANPNIGGWNLSAAESSMATNITSENLLHRTSTGLSPSAESLFGPSAILEIVEAMDANDHIKQVMARCGLEANHPREIEPVIAILPCLGVVGWNVVLRLLQAPTSASNVGAAAAGSPTNAAAPGALQSGANTNNNNGVASPPLTERQMAQVRAAASVMVQHQLPIPDLITTEGLLKSLETIGACGGEAHIAQILAMSRPTTMNDKLCAEFLLLVLDRAHQDPARHKMTSLAACSSVVACRQWELEDLIRIEPRLLQHHYILLLCQAIGGDEDPESFYASKWELILPKLIIENNKEQINKLTSREDMQNVSLARICCACIAKVLYCDSLHQPGAITPSNRSRISKAQQICLTEGIEQLETVCEFFRKNTSASGIHSLPSTVSRNMENIVTAVLSPKVCIPERLNRVLTIITSLALADGNREAVIQALGGKVVKGSQEVLTSCIFDVIDRVTIILGLTDPSVTAAMAAEAATGATVPPLQTVPSGKFGSENTCSIATQLRWLISLKGLLHFFGPHVSVISGKLSTILTGCSKVPHFWETISEIWHVVIGNLATELLMENGPALAVDIVTLEQLNIPAEIQRKLCETMKMLQRRTSNGSFWTTLYTGLSTSSKAVREAFKKSTRPMPDEILKGCAEGLESPSARSRKVFSQALHKALSTGEVIDSPHLVRIAPRLVPLLLRCCRDDDETSNVALICLGMIGAVPLDARNQRALVDADTFDPVQVVSWGDLVQKILDTYCFAALGETSDPTLHDRAAYAIQSLILHCTNEERRQKGTKVLDKNAMVSKVELQTFKWWRTLRKDRIDTYNAFTTTKYLTKVVQRVDRKTPEYVPDMDYATWVALWLRNLVGRTTNVHGKIFECVRNVAKKDLGFTTFLIPHLVLNIVIFAEEHHTADIITEIETVLQSNGEEHIQQIFVLFDCVTTFRAYIRKAPAHIVTSDVARNIYAKVKAFIERIPRKLLIESGIRVKCYARALMVIESDPLLASVSSLVNEGYDLQGIFSGLRDKDACKVVHHHSKHNNWGEVALSHERNGEFALALQCCELHLQQKDSVEHHLCTLRCMRQLGQLQLMSTYAKSAQSTSNVDTKGIEELQFQASEAAWRLQKWDTLTDDASSATGTALLELNKLAHGQSDLAAVSKATSNIRQSIKSNLLTSIKESYALGYSHLITLQASSDVDLAAAVMEATMPHATNVSFAYAAAQRANRPYQQPRIPIKYTQLIARLNRRLAHVDITEPGREVIVSLHRVIYDVLVEKGEAGLMCVEYAKFLRDSGFPQAALNALRQVAKPWDVSSFSRYHRLQAELMWTLGEHQNAIEFTVKHAADPSLPAHVRGALLLQRTIWKQQTGSETGAIAMNHFKEVIRLNQCEESHFEFAMFLDKTFQTITQNLQNGMASSSPLTGTSPVSAAPPSMDPRVLAKNKQDYHIACENYLIPMIDHFGLSLKFGHEYMFTSLPRLFGRWLDTSANFTKEGAPSRLHSMLLETATKHLIGTNALSTSILIAALSQIVSRLGHPKQETLTALAKITTALLQAYPQQVLWALLPLIYSASSRPRSDFVTRSILKPFDQWAKVAYKKDPKILERAKAIFNCLIDICNAPHTAFAEARLSQMSFVKRAQPHISAGNFVIPTQYTLTPRIPENFAVSGASSFPVQPTFYSFDDKVDIMSSIQKPKKIVVLTNIGERVNFLCKAKDEPRKDMRMMELAALLNNIFDGSAAGHHRRFKLRRYAVTALQDDCGIIEWVNNTTTIRSVCDDIYTQQAKGLRIQKLKEIKDDNDKRRYPKLEMMNKYVLPHFPPSMHIWLQQSFVRPSEWYEGRVAFTRSVALWSMVGHIVGLGDRHGENLLLDCKNGEIVHVDFASLFDAAEKLQVPERVRFRLTPNLIDVMGITGYNGAFRSCCELTLQTQRQHRDAIMGVLETFIHDPLVEWGKQKEPSPSAIFRRVRRRLDGFLDLLNEPSDPVAMSVEGQVEKLIVHCAGMETLCEMYFWWMPWL